MSHYPIAVNAGARMTAMRLAPRSGLRARQRGVSLFIVIVLVLLSMLLALWASRTSLFNELVGGNDADYQRAFEAAQALLQDAELDIRGEKADGTPCAAAPCRAYQQPNVMQYPGDSAEINQAISELAAIATRCKDGICARRVGRQDFWAYETSTTSITPGADATKGEVPLSDLMAVGARYGQYTGAANTTANGQLNPILVNRTSGEGGWYWVEIMPYSNRAKSANVVMGADSDQLPLNLDVYVVYRITALAKGRKANTVVVLQETYARQRKRD